MAQSDSPYPVQFSVDYLEELRDRLSVFLRVIMIIPIAIVLAVISGQSDGVPSFGGAAGGTLLLGPLLMIVFRRKYPRWWFDWNLDLFLLYQSVVLSVVDYGLGLRQIC